VVASGTDTGGAPLSRSVPLVVGGDSTPPALAEFSFSPASVDTSAGPKTITVRARLTDAGVGVAGEGYTRGATEARFKSPSGGQIIDALLYKLASGDASDGTYEWSMTLPSGSENGVWTLQYVMPTDKVGNRATLNTGALAAAGFPTTFSQTGAGDATPPVLRDLSFAPASVDTSTGPKTITVRARLTDAGVGVAGEGYNRGATEARFQSPSGNQIVDAILYKLVSGDAFDGTYEWTMTVPAGAESGTWTLQYVAPTDKVGNRANLTTTALAAAGFPTTFTQTGSGDNTAPTLREFSFTPTSVDTSTGPKTITVRARLTDAGVGVAGEGYNHGATEARFQSPSGQIVDAILYKLISGDIHDGIYEWTMTVPAGAEEGTWTLQYVAPTDKVGNRTYLNTAALAAAGFATTFEVVDTSS
jgi:subtilisin-like proprotein convertase family protein